MVSGEVTIQMLAELADKYWLWFLFAIIIAGFMIAFFYTLIIGANKYINFKFNEAQKKTPKQLEKLIKHELNINAPVNEYLDEIRLKYNASRVVVMQYHNWGFTNSWSHKSKISMTHEVVGQWVGHIAKEMQDIPSAIFTHANSRLLAWEDMTIIYNTITGDGNSDEGVVATYRSVWYTSVYALAIRKHGFLVAKVVVWYLSECRLEQDQLDDIFMKVKQIETLITLNDYEK